MENKTSTLEAVKDYYGKTLNNSTDLKTSACCAAEASSGSIRSILKQIHPEIIERFYGCGTPLPPVLEGLTVLDLGCGTGRDVYVAAKLVGEKGHVIGIDMTAEQLEVARKHSDWQAQSFGFKKPNTTFKQGYIEDLQSLDIADNSIDLVISNCVINLSPDKPRVFSEIFRSLRLGGEMYISDVFSDRRIPESLRQDPVLYGECLSGALYIEDFRRCLHALGCHDFRIVKSEPIAVTHPEIKAKLGNINFQSLTIRAYKLPTLEDRCEDYGQVAIYKGTIADHPHHFQLDDHHLFETGKAEAVCSNTVNMLSNSRYGKHFEVIGDESKHFGLFDCNPSVVETSEPAQSGCC